MAGLNFNGVNFRTAAANAGARVAETGRAMRASVTACRTSIATHGRQALTHGRQLVISTKNTSKDAGHAAFNFAGAYPNVGLDDPRHETWFNPKLRYLGTLPGQTGQTLSDSGLPPCKKLAFIISAGLLAISIGAPLSYIKNTFLTAAHDLNKSLQFALGSSCLESCFNLTQDHRTIFHKYFAAPPNCYRDSRTSLFQTYFN